MLKVITLSMTITLVVDTQKKVPSGLSIVAEPPDFSKPVHAMIISA
jgi:hypothetical protein